MQLDNGTRFSVSCISDDGQFALSTTWKMAVCLWDLGNGKLVRLFSGSQFSQTSAICFSPNSQLALTGSMDGAIHVWDLTIGEERCKILGHEDSVHSVCFSPDGKYALSSSNDFTIRMWGVRNVEEVRQFSKGEFIRHITASVCFSHDGKYAASRVSRANYKSMGR